MEWSIGALNVKHRFWSQYSFVQKNFVEQGNVNLTFIDWDRSKYRLHV
jgi:hypothetical protein